MSKFLINVSGNKAIRTGEYVEASSTEWVYDTDNIVDSDKTVAELKELAEANGLSVKSSWNRAELITNINQHFTRLDLPEQNKMSISAIIKEIVTSCADSRDPSEDSDAFEIDILTQVINRLREDEIAFKIKPIGGLVKKEIIEQGLVLTATARKEAVFDMLSEAGFAPESWSDVEEMVNHITEKVADTTEAQAINICRKYCKSAEIDFPKRTKPAKLPFRAKMIKFLIENRDADEEAVTAFLSENDKEKSLGTAMKLKEVIDQAYDAGAASVS